MGTRRAQRGGSQGLPEGAGRMRERFERGHRRRSPWLSLPEPRERGRRVRDDRAQGLGLGLSIDVV